MLRISPPADRSFLQQGEKGECESARPSNAGDGDEVLCGARNYTDSISVDGLHAPSDLHGAGVTAYDSPAVWHPADCPDMIAGGDNEALENNENNENNEESEPRTPISREQTTDPTAAGRLPRLMEAGVSGEFTSGFGNSREFTSDAVSNDRRNSVTSNQTLKSSMRGAFLASHDDHCEIDSPYRRLAAKILYSNATETIIASGVFTNLFFICLDTDARADQPDAPGQEPAMWITLGNFFLWLVFAFELLLRIYVERRAVITKPENLLDVAIIASGAIETIFWLVGMEISAVGMVRVLRLCRLLRLMRVLKLFKVLKELNRLIQMMGSCFRTLFWSTLLLILVMTVWACITVELINPLIQQLNDEHGYWDDCGRCQKSYSTVFDANLTLFQTIIAGDSWGKMAVPVISHHPWSAIVLCGSLMTLVFGTLNLIVAVIVDTFAEKRARDVVTMAQDLDSAEREEKDALSKIFEKIDENMDGSLTYEEIQEGAKRVAEFRHWLRVLDIDASDLYNLFVLLDEDGSGEIQPQEFIDAMHRIKNSESKTAMRFVKHLVTGVVRTQSNMADTIGSLENKMHEVTGALSQVMVLHDQQMEMQKHTQLKSETASAEIRQSLDKAMSEASQLAFQAALEAVGSAAQTVGDLKMAIDHDYGLSSRDKPNSPRNSPRSSSTSSRPLPLRKKRLWRREPVQADQDCVEEKSPKSPGSLCGSWPGSQVQDKPDWGRGYGADEDSTKLDTGGGPEADGDPESAEPLAILLHGGDQQSTDWPEGKPNRGSSNFGASSRPWAPSEKKKAGSPDASSRGRALRFGPRSGPQIPPVPFRATQIDRHGGSSEGFFAQFGPKGGSAKPPTPTKPTASGGQGSEQMSDEGHNYM